MFVFNLVLMIAKSVHLVLSDLTSLKLDPTSRRKLSATSHLQNRIGVGLVDLEFQRPKSNNVYRSFQPVPEDSQVFNIVERTEEVRVKLSLASIRVDMGSVKLLLPGQCLFHRFLSSHETIELVSKDLSFRGGPSYS